MDALSYRRCLNCGYIISDLPESRCPECGRSFNPADSATYFETNSAGKFQFPRSWMAELGLVGGINSVGLGYLGSELGGFYSALALISSAQGVTAWLRVRRRPNPPRARRLARIGLILSVTGIVVAGAGWTWSSLIQRQREFDHRAQLDLISLKVDFLPYAQANGWAFPPDLQGLRTAAPFVCNGQTYGIAGNGIRAYGYVGGLKWTDSVDWIVVYSDPRLRPLGGSAVFYVDGRIKVLSAWEFRREWARFVADYQAKRGAAPTILGPLPP